MSVSSSTARARVLAVNGIALGVTGVVQVVQELLSHYASAGVWGDIFRDSPFTIGVIEAHGFAALTGGMLVAVARRGPGRWWHLYAALVHLMLGTANLVFWLTFTEFDKVGLGIVATTVHAAFLALELACFALARGPAAGPTATRPAPSPATVP